MAATEPVTNAVVTSPSFVIVEDAAAFLPKFAIGVTVLIIGTLVFVGLMVFLSAMLPRIREATRLSLNNHPWQSFGMGLLGLAILGALAAFLIDNASVEYLLRTEYNPVMLGSGITVCALVVVMTFTGATGLVQAIGDRLESLNEQTVPGLRKTFLGALTLLGASLFPAIGWFVVVPLSLVFAFGAMLRSLLPRRNG